VTPSGEPAGTNISSLFICLTHQTRKAAPARFNQYKEIYRYGHFSTIGGALQEGAPTQKEGVSRAQAPEQALALKFSWYITTLE
jgi:hypothetical protein